MCLLANKGDVDALSAWLAGGADVNEGDYDGRTALHVVSCFSNTTSTILILRLCLLQFIKFEKKARYLVWY